MQKTSNLYQDLLQTDYKVETRLTIGEPGVLITKQGDSITFGSKAYTKTASGSTIVLTETEDRPMKGLRIFGKTTQNGTPTPEAPVPLDSVGNDGSVAVTVCGKNLLDLSGFEFNDSQYNHYFQLNMSEIAREFYDFLKANVGKTVILSADITGTPSGVPIGSIRFYDINNSLLYLIQPGIPVTIETKDTEAVNCYVYGSSTGATVKNYQIEYGTLATAYEPYKEPQTLTLSTPNGLPGIPVSSGGNYTDGNGQQWLCDEVDFEKGVYVQRVYSKVFRDATGWDVIAADKSKIRFVNRTFGNISLKWPDAVNKAANGLCSGFKVISGESTWYLVTGIAIEKTVGWMTLYYDGIEQTAEALGNYFASHPTTLMAELAEPIETALSAEQLAAFAALHTNYPNTTVFNDEGADMEIEYTMNGDGPSRILTGVSGADSGYDETVLISMETDARVFSEDTPEVGASISSQIDIEMIKPFAELPKQARLVPYVRLSDGLRHSEWIQKGVYYIDTRSKVEDGSSIEKIVLHGYDDMLKAEQDYPESTLSWPARDLDVIQEIAEFIGVAVDDRTVSIMNRGYTIQYPTGYSCRDVLGYIAAMYAGSFIMSDLGDLRLVTIYGIPKETRYLIEPNGYVITFGGDRILV